MKRTLACILAALMVTPLVACGGGKNNNGSNASVTYAPETAAETVDPNYVGDDLGDLNMNGGKFTMYLACQDPKNHYAIEEETGELLNDVEYQRNIVIEDRFNLKLDYFNGYVGSDGSSQSVETAAISKFIEAGDTSFDAYIHVQHTGMPGLILQGYFMNWYDVPHIDLTKPYWYNKVIRDINYGTKVFTMSGAYHLSTLTSANCLIFNKNLFEDANIEYPYQSVIDGTWTYEKLAAIVKDSARDLNGDGTMTVGDDLYAYGGWQWEIIPALFMGMGGDVLLKGEDGSPVLSIETDRNVEIIEKIYEIFSFNGSYYEGKTYSLPHDAFEAGKMLFYHGSLGVLGDFRDMEDDFGFLPYPKFDEEQEDYNIRIQNTSGLTYLPVTNNNLDVTGVALEALSWYSYNNVVPTYFDQVLTYKTARDQESEQMVPFFRTYTSYYDEAISFSILAVIQSGNSLVTYYASQRNKVETAVAELAEFYK